MVSRPSEWRAGFTTVQNKSLFILTKPNRFTTTYSMNNQPNTNERFNYDAQSQEKAVEQINAIAQANGIKYVLICDEDFFTATNDYPELPFTVADAENYKERVLENLMDSFFQESTDVIDSIADKRSEQNKKNS
jgi:predicted DsbA family dithiol-disulfide isomerase